MGTPVFAAIAKSITQRPLPGRVFRNGFSLVETAIALGIVSFACVSMIGLIPIGLMTFQQAIGTTIEAQIVQNLSNDILLADFSDLYKYTFKYGAQTYYYDNEGVPLIPVAAGTVPDGTIYTVVVSLSVVNNSNSLVALYDNGISTVGKPSPDEVPTISSAYNVTMTVSRKNRPGSSQRYSVIVANNNQ